MTINSALRTLNLSRPCLLALMAQVALSVTAAAQSTQPTVERKKEMELAVSACPPRVASQAAVYVLEKSGTSRFGIVKMASRQSLTKHFQQPRSRNAWMRRERAPSCHVC